MHVGIWWIYVTFSSFMPRLKSFRRSSALNPTFTATGGSRESRGQLVIREPDQHNFSWTEMGLVCVVDSDGKEMKLF